jgi:hypothetical protein
MALPSSGQISMSQIETELFHGSNQPNPPGSNPSRYFNLDSNFVRNLASANRTGPLSGTVPGQSAINTPLSTIAMSNLYGKTNYPIDGVIQEPVPFYYRFEKEVSTGGEYSGTTIEYYNRRGYPLCNWGGAPKTDVWVMTSDAANATQNPSNVFPGSYWGLYQLQGTGALSFKSFAAVPQYLKITFIFFIGATSPTKFGIQKNATAGTTGLGGAATVGTTIGISGRGANWDDLTVGTSLSQSAGSAYQSFWDPTPTLISNGFNRVYVPLVNTDIVYPGQQVDYYAACKTIVTYDYEGAPDYVNYQVDYNGLYTANVEQTGWPLG